MLIFNANLMKKKKLTYFLITTFKLEFFGGESGIRTHDRVAPIHAFQACAFSHSATSPKENDLSDRSPEKRTAKITIIYRVVNLIIRAE